MNKYLKYKYKYLKLKEMVGGLDDPPGTPDTVRNMNIPIVDNNVLEQYDNSYHNFINNYTFKNGYLCWEMEELANRNLEDWKNINNTTIIDTTHEIDTTHDKIIQELTKYLDEIKTNLANLNTNILNLSIQDLINLFIKLSKLNDNVESIIGNNTIHYF